MSLTVSHAGKTYANFEEAALLTAGVPVATIEVAKAAARRELIKAECRRRIYGVASSEAQLNISGAATAISAKTAANRSADETNFLATFAASLTWIMDMRAAVETLSADVEAEFLTDTAWPPCPPDVLTLAANY